MPRTVQKVSDMEIDEVSLVDRAACPPASVVIAKRADQEVGMDPDFVDENGELFDVSNYEPGTHFDSDDGNDYFIGDDGSLYVNEAEPEPETAEVGKSAFFADPDQEVIDRVKDELSKAVSDDDRADVIAKALGEMRQENAIAQERLARAEEVAKSERDLRLQREYIAKAAEMHLPVSPEELGPVLMRAADSLSYEDCSVLNKALTTSGSMLFDEIGYDGQAGDNDTMAEIDAMLDESVQKSNGELSKAGAVTTFFDQNPDAYDAYRAENR